jgi:hypothetical protein
MVHGGHAVYNDFILHYNIQITDFPKGSPGNPAPQVNSNITVLEVMSIGLHYEASPRY